MNNVGPIVDQTLGIRSPRQNMTQGSTIPATDVGNEPRARKIVRFRQLGMPIVGYVRHHGIKGARLLRMLAEIIEATSVPSRLMRYSARHGCIQFAPSIPRSATGPKAGCVMH